jgi:hypothetical protein
MFSKLSKFWAGSSRSHFLSAFLLSDIIMVERNMNEHSHLHQKSLFPHPFSRSLRITVNLIDNYAQSTMLPEA